MKRVLELIKWDSCGIGVAEKFACELSEENNFKAVSRDALNNLLELKGYPLELMKSRHHDYYIYFNNHHTSGHKTILFVNDDGDIYYRIKEPEGYTLQAFFCEVIIFTLTDRF